MKERQRRLDDFVRKAITMLRKCVERVLNKTIAEIIYFALWQSADDESALFAWN